MPLFQWLLSVFVEWTPRMKTHLFLYGQPTECWQFFWSERHVSLLTYLQRRNNYTWKIFAVGSIPTLLLGTTASCTTCICIPVKQTCFQSHVATMSCEMMWQHVHKHWVTWDCLLPDEPASDLDVTSTSWNVPVLWPNTALHRKEGR